MKPVLRWGALGLGLYAIFLVATLPAAWVYSWNQDKLGNLALYGIRGSLWSGQAALAQVGSARLEHLDWAFQPWALLLGRAQAALEFDYQDTPGTTVMGRSLGGQLRLRDVTLTLPATQLDALLKLPGVTLGGQVEVALDAVDITAGRITYAAGLLTWQNAAVQQPVPTALGTFVAHLDTNDESVTATLTDDGGAVQTEGLFALKPDGNYQFNGSFAPRGGDQSAAIAQGLRLFGNAGPDGKVHLTRSGVLPPL